MIMLNLTSFKVAQIPDTWIRFLFSLVRPLDEG